MSTGGVPPKLRHIQPLRFPGQVSVNRDGVELYDIDSDEDLHLSDNASRMLDGSQSAAGDRTVDRIRAQSAGGSYRLQSTRSTRSMFVVEVQNCRIDKI